jgi:hypothetical protein
MKKLTSTVFAALIGLTLCMPAFSQATQTPPDNSKKSAPASKDDSKTKKSTKKTKKDKTKKTDSTSTTTGSDKNAPPKK